jgi:hypothetical protein
MTGHCYVAAEATYHLAGERAGFRPHFMGWEDSPHWYLADDDGTVIDPTVAQFGEVPDYSLGRGKGFLTREPSLRAVAAMERYVALDHSMGEMERALIEAPVDFLERALAYTRWLAEKQPGETAAQRQAMEAHERMVRRLLYLATGERP